ncbi:pentafunctional AROM polypeptide [Gaeumannomyces tritici R3-111a-1]|uniref:Pentafunctional AROM polypeptide n=1 Tax=Gaeumannomyces tritici (strain R3-111a-1) TaxID=644352 RepID=J3NG78_GAET3|nr:pentafunctional AROM polypeptide [Gaeumannomyces tritici R3-111a-1]EJT80268.1 pentafunctional AROM polypeptide [Gaeumannomyces tritici R3-111a-1]
MAAVQKPFTFPPQAPASSALPISLSTSNSLGNDDVNMDMGGGSQPASLRSCAKFGSGPQRGDTRIVAIMYGPGQENIVSVFAEVLGQSFRLGGGFAEVAPTDRGVVVGIPASRASADLASRNRELVVAINAHCVDLGMPPDAHLSSNCDYEFLYTTTPFFRRDLVRFISFTLGQINHHETLMAKSRTFMLSTTFPDVRAALPNIDILTVGADAIELRVDLLREPLPTGGYAAVPSLSYVGEQVMLLRQRTELPIIFTTRCTRENGRFPMERPELYYEYLSRAIQWGLEYVDVELWLPEEMRKQLYEKKGSSRIMSAFHDFSGTFRWPSSHAQSVFLESSRYADIIKMIAIVNDHNENFELEYFRLKMRAEYPDSPPFSGVNMGEIGQFSRTLNRVFTPITHPLLPLIGAPGQISAAEINAALASVGQLPKRSIYGISGPASRGATPQAPFYEKCFNELGLPHQFAVVERGPRGTGGIEAWCSKRNFGGAYLNPPIPHQSLVSSGSHFFQSVNGGAGPILTEAAQIIGMVDTIVVRPGPASPAGSAPTSIPSSPSPGRLHHPHHPHHTRHTSFSERSGSSNSASSGNGNGSMHSVLAENGGLPAGTTLVFDNALWRGILSTLTRDLAPSAYFGCTAVVLAGSPDDAASVLFALKELRVSKVFTVGFKTPPALAQGLDIEPFTSLESLQRARSGASSPPQGASAERGALGLAARTEAVGEARLGQPQQQAQPFVVISALGSEKSNIVGMLLKRVFGSQGDVAGQQQQPRRVFLDLAEPGGIARRTDPGPIAEQSGFSAYGFADTAAFTTVETLRLLVGQNVPYSFVRLASGRILY